MKRFMTAVVLLGAVTLAPVAVQAQAPTKDIVATAVAAGTFNTLARALTAAGLIETLKGPGPVTVFAPTDAAFAKLPPATLTALLADKKKLTAVLTYHVVSGKVMAAQVVGMTEGDVARPPESGPSQGTSWPMLHPEISTTAPGGVPGHWSIASGTPSPSESGGGGVC